MVHIQISVITKMYAAFNLYCLFLTSEGFEEGVYLKNIFVD